MGYVEDRLKEEIIPKLPDVTSLPENLYLIYFAGLHSAAGHLPSDLPNDEIIKVFTEVAHIFLKNFTTPARITVPLSGHIKTHLSYVMRFEEIFKLPTPYLLDREKRFSHTWICADSGAGKTTLLENLIEPDVEDVKAGKGSVVVIDSQGRNELIGRIEKWRVLDDVSYKIIDTTTPMNPFVMGQGRAHTEREREMLQNNAIATISYVFSSTLGDGGNFTAKQRTLFDYCVQLLLMFDSSIVDMLALMQPKGLDRYRQHIARLPPAAQFFFHNEFDRPKAYTDTKTEISWRLAGILKNPAFARMFTTSHSIDFYTELAKPQLLLVDTDKAMLGTEGSEIFGRFVIAQLLSAAQQRANDRHRLPVYVYIDEAQDYIANDENIATIVDQARKMKVGVSFSHQRESQIKNANVLDALKHCAIQFLPTRQYYFNLTVKGALPIEIYSPLVERERRAPPKQYPRVAASPPLEGEVVPPNRPTSQDNRALPFPRKWDKDEME